GIVARAGDGPLEGGARELAFVAADIDQPPVERRDVPRLVPALPLELHAKSPRSLGKIDEALRGDVEAGDLVRHVAVDHLPARFVAKTFVLVHLGFESDDLEARVARRLFAHFETAADVEESVFGHDPLLCRDDACDRAVAGDECLCARLLDFESGAKGVGLAALALIVANDALDE